jgi:hypothetical protein
MHEACIFTSKMYEDKVEAILYRQIVGKLLYLTNNRPNITFATNILSHFMQAPQRPHMEAQSTCCATFEEPVTSESYSRKTHLTSLKATPNPIRQGIMRGDVFIVGEHQ